MSRCVLIMDTSVLCCWFQVPDKDIAGPSDDRWDHNRIDARIQQAMRDGSTLVLPLATLIETGNHIAQAKSLRFECGQKLAQCLRDAANAQTPWAAFTDQSALWQSPNLVRLADEWPALAKSKLSIGDATIKDVAEYYARTGWSVEILTGDRGLKSYQPLQPAVVPRRRR